LHHRAFRKSVDQILGCVGRRHTPGVGARKRSQQLRSTRRQLFAFFTGGLAAGGVGGAFGFIFSFAGLTAGGFGGIGMT